MALQESLRHLNTSFDKFYKKEAGFPRFKSRWDKQSSYHCVCVSVGEGYVKVPKMKPIKAVGWGAKFGSDDFELKGHLFSMVV